MRIMLLLQKDEVYLNLVLEYIPETVYRVSRHYSKNKLPLPLIYIKVMRLKRSNVITWEPDSLSLSLDHKCTNTGMKYISIKQYFNVENICWHSVASATKISCCSSWTSKHIFGWPCIWWHIWNPIPMTLLTAVACKVSL